MSLYRNIKKTIQRAHPKMIEAFYKFYADSEPKKQKELMSILQVTEVGIRKRINKMSQDEVTIYWGILGGRVHMVYEDTTKGLNYKSMQQLIQTSIAKKTTRDEALSGEHIHVYSTKENLKYLSYLANYQNSRWYLANKDYKHLAKNVKSRRKVAEFEDKESDFATFFKITTGGFRLLKYMSYGDRMDTQQAYILQLLASNLEKTMPYDYILDKTSGVMPKIRVDRSIRKLVNRKFIYSFGEKNGRAFSISSQGETILTDAINHAIETF